MSLSRPSLLLTVLAALALCAGCGEKINTTYGRRAGSGATSVNGTTVLGKMFEEAGHDVRSWTVLSPSLNDAEVIVWAPDDFDVPPAEVQEWLSDWLHYSYAKKTLIYIGRDHDAAPTYWEFAKQSAPPEKQAEFDRRFREAKLQHRANQADLPDSAEWIDWFTIEGKHPQEEVTTLSGPWAEGIDASKTQIIHQGRIVPHEDAEVLLATGDGQPLVTETTYRWGEVLSEDGTEESEDDVEENDYRSRWEDEAPPARLIVVENGSFLLNVPLVNHEHRKLAGKLVEEVGDPPQRVVFLQSQAGGPPVLHTDPSDSPPTALALFSVWPLSGVLLHLSALGLLYALACWPLFGLPRLLPRQSLTDFGAHVTALGQLLQRRGGANYARMVLANYRQTTQGDDS